MSATRFAKWGNSLAVRISEAIAAAAKLAESDPVEIEAADGTIVGRPAASRHTMKTSFEQRSAAEWHADFANAYDWGEDRGREIVEE